MILVAVLDGSGNGLKSRFKMVGKPQCHSLYLVEENRWLGKGQPPALEK